MWAENGYIDALKLHYRLILIDARGHGASDKPHNRAAYTWPIPVQDVVTVLDYLAIDQAHVMGYSYGGPVCYGLAKHAPSRVTSLRIRGMPAQTGLFAPFQHVDGTDPEAFFAAFEAKLWSQLPPEARAWMAQNDLQAIAAAAQDRPSLEDVLPQMTMPCLLFVGEADPAHPARARDREPRPQCHLCVVSGSGPRASLQACGFSAPTCHAILDAAMIEKSA